MQGLLLLQALGSSMDVLYPSDVRARLERTSTSAFTLLSFERPPALLVQFSICGLRRASELVRTLKTP
jgi:hypothetical protein